MASDAQLKVQLEIIRKEGFPIAQMKGVSVANKKVRFDISAMEPSQFDTLSGSMERISKATKKCAGLIATLQAET